MATPVAALGRLLWPFERVTATIRPMGLLVGSASTWSPMNDQSCPICTMTEILNAEDRLECATCGHEWEKASTEAPTPRIVKDAGGNILQSGDSVTLIKDLRLKGGSGTLKVGTKAKNIRIVDGDHEIDCKIDGVAMMLKACFVKRA